MTGERVVEFVQLLRHNGLRVSPGETMDAVQALALVGVGGRAEVRSALRSTLVKRGADAATFDRLFDLYFGGMGRLLEGLEQTLARGLSEADLSLEDWEEIGKLLEAQGVPPMAQALATGRLGEITRLLRAAAVKVDFRALGAPMQRGWYARRIGATAGLPQTRSAWQNLTATLADQGLDPAVVERVSKTLGEALAAVEDTARRVADLEQKARDRTALATDPQSALQQRPLASLSPQELAELQRAVRRLAEKLKTRIGAKRRRRRRGQLHVRRTLRRNLALGGVPAQLSFRARRPARPEVVVLCDVSDSVRNVSRLMLQFVHCLQSLYARVRSFVFVSDLGEITSLLKSTPIEQAADGAVAGRVISLAANSNYGHAFRLFHADFRGAVTRRTTLIVIGDGRSNYNPPNAWVLEELARKARQVVWLCPESRSSWGFGDSEMNAYARHCDQTFVVRTFEELARAVESLLP